MNWFSKHEKIKEINKPLWKFENEQLYFRYFVYGAGGYGETVRYYETEKKVDDIIMLGRVLDEYNVNKNLAKELVRLNMPEEYEKMLILAVRKKCKENLIMKNSLRKQLELKLKLIKTTIK